MTHTPPDPLPVELSDPIELVPAPTSHVQLVAVVGLVAGLLACLAIVGVAVATGRQTPDVLDVTLGALAGSLGTLLIGRGR